MYITWKNMGSDTNRCMKQVCNYACIHVYECVYTYIYIYIYIYVTIHRYMHKCVCMMCIYIYIYMHMCIYIYMYIYTHIHTHIHTLNRSHARRGAVLRRQQRAAEPLQGEGCAPRRSSISIIVISI